MTDTNAAPGAGDGAQHNESFPTDGSDAIGRDGYRWYRWATELMRHPTLDDGAKVAAQVLASLADNRTGVTLPTGHDRLAERCGKGGGSAKARKKFGRRATTTLIEACALEVVQRGGGRGRATVYRLLTDVLADVPALSEKVPADGDVSTEKVPADGSKGPRGRGPYYSSSTKRVDRGRDAGAARRLAEAIVGVLDESPWVISDDETTADLARVVTSETDRAARECGDVVPDEVFVETARLLADDPEPTENVAGRYRAMLRDCHPMRDWKAGY